MELGILENGVGIAAAVIAALTGIVNLVLLLKGRTDKFVVRYWSVFPVIDEGHQFSVISTSDHPVHIVDYGYILEDMTMCSVEIELQVGSFNPDDVDIYGNHKLEHHGQVLDIHMRLAQKPIATYAQSATQRRFKVAFKRGTPLWKRLYIRFMMLFNPYHFF